MLEELKKQVYDANMLLPKYGLVTFTWGNVSGIDAESRLFVIKPSGVDYEKMTPDDMVVMDLDGNKVEGDYNPSSDTPTHLELYKAFPEIGGVVHTHSSYATSFAQAGRDIPCYGTTHADYSSIEIPCTRRMTKDEVEHDFELNTGKVITECLREEGISSDDVSGVLVHSHGPFTWGYTPMDAVKHMVILETISEMAFKTLQLNPDAVIDDYLVKKHYDRKHGNEAYYGPENR